MQTTIDLNCEKCGLILTASVVKRLSFGQPPEFWNYREVMDMHGWGWMPISGKVRLQPVCPDCLKTKEVANGIC